MLRGHTFGYVVCTVICVQYDRVSSVKVIGWVTFTIYISYSKDLLSCRSTYLDFRRFFARLRKQLFGQKRFFPNRKK